MHIFDTYPDLLTFQEAVDALRITPEAMRQLMADGTLLSCNIAGNILFPKAILHDYVEHSAKVCYAGEVGYPASVPKGAGALLLDKPNERSGTPPSEGDADMASKINQPVFINGTKRWITAGSMQEFADKVMKFQATPQNVQKHPFDAYAWTWFETYSKPNVETATATTYKRQLTCHLLPAFAGMAVEDITSDDVQRLFNGMDGAKATKEKARMVLNQILDAAVEDKLISSNPAKSKKVKVKGATSRPTTPYSVEQMRYLVKHIGDVQNPVDRAYLALQALHPFRLEEVLGLQFSDIDPDGMTIHVRRAVTHPTRNQPEVKDTKTESSARPISLSTLALPHLPSGPQNAFLFGGDTPLSYTQVRKMCARIKRDTGFDENITPIRFRTTVLTDLYDRTKDIKLTQEAAGHSSPSTTMKHYVKGREDSKKATAAVEQAYST